MTGPDLSQLRDIHLPPPVGWWPPAPGWWALAGLLLAGLIAAAWLWRRHRRNRWRRQALLELRRLRGSDDAQLLRGLSALLRRVAISRHPRQEVAGLHGEAWLAFLDRSLGEGESFRAGPGRVLAAGPYAAAVTVEAEPLLALCERWIKRQRGGGR